jgi:hypothetical protein
MKNKSKNIDHQHAQVSLSCVLPIGSIGLILIGFAIFNLIPLADN